MHNTYSINAETNSYWMLLKDASSEVKLRLISRLSQSVMEDVSMSAFPMTFTGDKSDSLSRFAGAWKGDDSAESIIGLIRDNKSCKDPINFD